MTEPDRERLATIKVDHRHLLRDTASLTLIEPIRQATKH